MRDDGLRSWRGVLWWGSSSCRPLEPSPGMESRPQLSSLEVRMGRAPKLWPQPSSTAGTPDATPQLLVACFRSLCRRRLVPAPCNPWPWSFYTVESLDPLAAVAEALLDTINNHRPRPAIWMEGRWRAGIPTCLPPYSLRAWAGPLHLTRDTPGPPKLRFA